MNENHNFPLEFFRKSLTIMEVPECISSETQTYIFSSYNFQLYIRDENKHISIPP